MRAQLTMMFTIAAAAAVSAWAPASAQDAGWRVNCSTDRMTDDRSCVITKTVWPEPGRRYVTLALNDGRFGLLTNTGDVGRRARLRIGKENAFETDACSGPACVFNAASSVELAKQMADGQTALAEFTLANGTVIGPLEMPIDGLLQAMAKAREEAKK